MMRRIPIGDLDRYRFFDVFRIKDDGNLEVNTPLQIKATILYPGIPFRYVDKVDVLEYADKDIAAFMKDNGILEFQGFYTNDILYGQEKKYAKIKK